MKIRPKGRKAPKAQFAFEIKSVFLIKLVMIPEAWLHHIPNQEKSQGLGIASALALVRCSGDLWGNQPCTQFLLLHKGKSQHMGHLHPTDPASPCQEKGDIPWIHHQMISG